MGFFVNFTINVLYGVKVYVYIIYVNNRLTIYYIK